MIIDRYVTQVCALATLGATAAITLLLSTFGFLEELAETDAAYTFWDACWFLLQTLPRRVDELLIYGVLVGYLLALGKLAEAGELTALRTAGMSPSRLMLSLAPSLLMWIVISLSLSEWLAPLGERWAVADKIQAKQAAPAAQTTTAGLWLKDEGLFMQVGSMSPSGELTGVTQYWLDDEGKLIETVIAETAQYDATIGQWTLIAGEAIQFSDITTDARRILREPFRSRQWSSNITPNMIADQAYVDPAKMSMLALVRQVQFFQGQNLSDTAFQLALWNRITRPLMLVCLAYLALAAVLGPLRQTGIGLRLSAALMVGLGLRYLQDLTGLTAYLFAVPAALAAAVPIACAGGSAHWLLKRDA